MEQQIILPTPKITLSITWDRSKYTAQFENDIKKACQTAERMENSDLQNVTLSGNVQVHLKYCTVLKTLI